MIFNFYLLLFQISIGLNNNSIDLYSLFIKEKNEIKHLRSITNHGHRSEIRAICFSSDNLAFATASADSVKLWNRYIYKINKFIKKISY